MSLFRLDASISGDHSVTRAVADTLQKTWQAEHPEATVVRRDVGAEPLDSHVWPTAAFAGYTPAESRTDEQNTAVAVAAKLADELIDADCYVFAVPLYNFGVATNAKAWIDVVLTDPRFPPNGNQPLKGRPAVLVIARGGGYGVGTPREGWDHALPYLRRIFSDVLGLELEVVEAELTLAPRVPAMEFLRPLAAESLANAHTRAEHLGRTLVDRIPA